MDEEMTGDPWISVRTAMPHENEVVETKVEDCDGTRNVQTLKRHSNLWWNTDGSGTYIYYTPTHWRRI